MLAAADREARPRAGVEIKQRNGEVWRGAGVVDESGTWQIGPRRDVRRIFGGGTCAPPQNTSQGDAVALEGGGRRQQAGVRVTGLV